MTVYELEAMVADLGGNELRDLREVVDSRLRFLHLLDDVECDCEVSVEASERVEELEERVEELRSAAHTTAATLNELAVKMAAA